MFRKIICLVLVALMFVFVLSACGANNDSGSSGGGGSSSSSSSSGDSGSSSSGDSGTSSGGDTSGLDFVKLQIFMPGDQSARMREFAANELKEKMLEDLNCELEFSYAPWGDYWNKLGLLLSTGEDIDFFWDGIGSLANHYARKEVMPLDDLLNQYGQDLLKNIPIKNFDTARMADGLIYAIPSQAAASAGKFYSVLVRQDLLEGVGMSKIESIADLEQFAELGKTAYPDKVGMVERTMFRPLTRELAGGTNIAAWPLNDELFWVDEDDSSSTVKSVFDAPFYQEYCQLIYDWIQKGYTTEQVTSDASELDRL
ncbi:MAG: extracellular solute-binding protein [Oscillospiraceae bacterium]|nr:extracellular solute-binding protein [Oscillospiraceae bacterium]